VLTKERNAVVAWTIYKVL